MCGGDGKKVTPVPIPNTEVKLLSADCSEGFPFVRVGRCRAIFSFKNKFSKENNLQISKKYCIMFKNCSLHNIYIFGGLAQLGERLPYKQDVSGSIPLTSIVIVI